VFTYENGLVIAFLLWLYNTISIIVAFNSTLERNLNRMGKRHSYLTLQAVELTSEDQARSTLKKLMVYLGVMAFNLVFVIFSWLQVAVLIATLVYRKSQDFGAPQSVKEFRWKMKNVDMPFDQLMKALMKLNEEDPSNFEVFRERVRNNLLERDLVIR
jgi:hypothetical protein